MNFNRLILLLTCLVALVATARPVLTPARLAQVMRSQVWLDGWTYRQQITISSNLVASGIVLTNFPYAVNLATSAGLAAHAKADAGDIRFADASATNLLTHEIEAFTNSTGAITAFVRLPHLSSTSNTTIFCYYGNAGATMPTNAVQVWSDPFVGVWHLNATNELGRWPDSTANAHLGTNYGAQPTAGRLASGALFTGNATAGTNVVTDTLSIFNGITNATFSAWMKIPTTTGLGVAMDKGQLFDLGYGWTAHKAGFWNTSGGWVGVASSNDVDNNTWTHIVGVKEGTARRIYVNGILQGSTSGGNAAADTTPNQAGFGTDHNGVGGANFFNGTLDEAHALSVALSSAWIRTEFLNQASNSVYQTVSTEESR